MTPLVFAAENLARGWMSVFEATAKQATAHGAFRRTIVAEFHPRGVRLVATDTTLLLTAWVPTVGDEDEAPPAYDEPAKMTAVAIDDAGRAKGLLKYALGLCGPDAYGPVEIAVTVADAADEAPQGRLDLDVGGELLVLDLPGMERVRLGLWDGVWPSWPALFDGFVARKTSAVALAPDMIARLAHLGAWNEGPVLWEWSGPEKLARIRIGEAPVVVHGLVMPTRWLPADLADEATDEAPPEPEVY